jgi:hypothetical protein
MGDPPGVNDVIDCSSVTTGDAALWFQKIAPTPTDCAGLSSPRRTQKYASCRWPPKYSVFFVRNITIERSCRTGEAERVRWVYEWGGGSESGAKDATASFIARTAHRQTPTVQGTTQSCGMRVRQPSGLAPINLWGCNRLSPNRSAVFGL